MDWSWQPFGPGETIYGFTLPGSHYRGFPVIKVTSEQKRQIERGEKFSFVYRKTKYVAFEGKVLTYKEWLKPILANHDRVLNQLLNRE